MTDTGLLKIRQGKLLVRGGKLAKTCPIKRTANACPLCGDDGTGFWRDVTIAGIESIFEACVELPWGNQSILISATPSVEPNGTFRILFYSYHKNVLAGDPDLAHRDLVQSGLFQSSDVASPDLAEHCLWSGGVNSTGYWREYFASKTCAGDYTSYTIERLVVELRLYKDIWRIEVYYEGRLTGGSALPRYKLYVAYKEIARSGSDVAELNFSAIGYTTYGLFSGGTASVVSLGDPIAQEDLAQHSPDEPLFQGDLW